MNPMTTTKSWAPRAILGLLACLALTLAACGESTGSSAAERSETGQALLDAAVPGGDHPLGEEDAPLLIVEYASLTCSHCAAFHSGAFPQLKEQYIDTGKVYYILRPFPFDPLATAGFMLAACAGEERYFNFIDVLFEKQAQWAFVQDPREQLEKLAKQGGFSDESFEACMTNQEVYEPIAKTGEVGAEEFEVRSTPTLFVGGERIEGSRSWEEFEPILKEKLGE